MQLRQRHFIDSHKLATGLATLGLMAAYDAWDNATAWLYLGLHGGYGVLWALKSRSFPDSQWEAPCGVPWGLTIWGALSLYWVSPWLITSRDLAAPPWLVGVATLTFTLPLPLPPVLVIVDEEPVCRAISDILGRQGSCTLSGTNGQIGSDRAYDVGERRGQRCRG